MELKEQSDEPRIHGELTPVGWTPGTTELTWGQWKEIGRALGRVELATKFARGDWLRYGEHRWGGKYAEAVTESGLAYDTVRQERYVAGRVKFGYRKPNLSWSHHLAVAPLEPDEQKQWLSRAETEGMSVARLRDEIDRARLRPTERHTAPSSETREAPKEPEKPEPGERESIAEKGREITRRGVEEKKEFVGDLFGSAMAGEAKEIAGEVRERQRRDELGLRDVVSTERLVERLRMGGVHEPEVRRGIRIMLDLVAEITGEADPEEVAEEMIRPEDTDERLQQAEEAAAWFGILAEALARR